MSASCVIAVDAMGGDHGPQVTVPAALLSVKNDPLLSLILVGDEAQINPLLKAASADSLSRIEIFHTDVTISMDAVPSRVLREKRPNSISIAIDSLVRSDADACVSAGNTGALMALASVRLGRIDGVSKPAICTAVPSVGRESYLLDLGANIESSPEVMLQHALLGAGLASALNKIESPTVALLNVGKEQSKGGAEIQASADLMEADPRLNFCGFVEGSDLFFGKADVVVCNGFVGNIALKTSEGVARLVAYHLRQAFSDGLLAKLVALISRPVLMRVYRKIDPRRFNGASFLGLNGVLVKSHGDADALAFSYAIAHAAKMVRCKVIAATNRAFVIQHYQQES